MLTFWELIEADMHERYGIDVESGVLDARTGRWLRARIIGLLGVESRLHRALFPEQYEVT